VKEQERASLLVPREPIRSRLNTLTCLKGIERMKILHVVGSLDRGGIETWLAGLLHHVDRQKYQMDFLVHTAQPGAYDDEVRSLGARVLACLPRLDAGHPLQYARNFRRIVRQNGPYDCIHCHIHHSSGFILLLAAWMGIPIRIVQSHNDTRASDARNTALRRASDAVMDWLIHRYATTGIAASKAATRCLFPKSWGSAQASALFLPSTLPLAAMDRRWEISACGIDLAPFRGAEDKARLRAELGLSRASVIIGHVGRFAPQKNQVFLLEIAERLCRIEPAAVFLLVGEGPDREAIEKQVVERGLSPHFVFAGSRADVPRLMKGVMDCFLFPSLYEGLGLVLWEAQAAGLSCLITDSLPEEATILPEQVRRLSLSMAPEVWAGELLRMANTYSRRPPEDLPAAVAAVSIEASAARITQLYDRCMKHHAEQRIRKSAAEWSWR
jgi:glycosyltransferase involved in cell wall biosynthesis